MFEFKTFVGIDISKKTFDAALICKDIASIQHHCFPQNKEGFTAFLHWLKRQQVTLADTLICMEHTGLYVYQRHHSFSGGSKGTSLGRDGY